MNSLKNTICLFGIFLTGILSAQEIEGDWNMVGMKSGKVRSTIEIYEQGNKFYGKVVKVFPAPGDDANPTCEKCTDSRKNKPVVGMNIITGLEYDSRREEYINGKILDPLTGTEYSCRAWIDPDNNLVIRGYMMFFYKTYILPRTND